MSEINNFSEEKYIIPSRERSKPRILPERGFSEAGVQKLNCLEAVQAHREVRAGEVCPQKAPGAEGGALTEHAGARIVTTMSCPVQMQTLAWIGACSW